MSGYRRWGKRVFDLVLVVGSAPFWLPLAVAVLVVTRISLGSPLLFKQTRPGLGGQLFTIYKLRTMNDVSDDRGDLLPDSERLTKVGSFLRRSSLDELPELFNVLRGDMSLVGPRPLLAEYLPLYDDRQARRHEVRPGITGWAQASGRNLTDWGERLEQDVWYVENMSLMLDVEILARTIPAVLLRRGISQPGQATMRRFEG